MRNIPNILSCLRILMVCVFIYLFTKQEYLWCLILYITAFLTDVLDGYLARHNNWITDLGKLLDPFADKFMLLAVLACLVSIKKLPLFVLILVVVKEVLLVCGGLFVLKKRKVAVYADWWGKVATGLFFSSITLMLAKLAFDPHLSFIPDLLLQIVFFTALAISIFSLFRYAYKGGFIGKKYREKNLYEEEIENVDNVEGE